MAYPTFVRWPAILIGMIVGGYLVSLGLETSGLFGPTWEIRDGLLVSHAGALEIREGATSALLVLASTVTFVIAGIHAAALARAGHRQQQQIVAQAWHLRQLLPRP